MKRYLEKKHMLDTHTNLASLLKDPSLLVAQAYLAGEWVDGDNEARFEVVNPARGDVIAKVADISRAQTAQAIAAAEKAQAVRSASAKEVKTLQEKLASARQHPRI